MEAAINRLSAFFKGRDTHLGLFGRFPEPCSGRPRPGEAPARRLWEDLISVSGEEVVHFAPDHWLQDGLWDS